MEDSLVSLISNVGFPIAVCAYLMLRFEGKLENLNKSIVNLTVIIAKMNGINIDKTNNNESEENKIWQLK